MYRFQDGQLQVLLVHPGGPFFTNKDEGVWLIPKGCNRRFAGQTETPDEFSYPRIKL